MALADFQTALGKLVRGRQDRDAFRLLHLDENERSCLETLTDGRGFRVTVGVQRSWCIGRAKKAGGLTLSMLPAALRERLVDDWTGSGGGTSSFFLAEADAFLDFVAGRLADPSHELTICRFEQATLRANDGAGVFAARRCDAPEPTSSALRRGRYAAMVFFHGVPDEIMSAAVEGRPLPALSPEAKAAILFAPGFAHLCRPASFGEIALWRRLATSAEMTELCREGHRREDVEAMLLAGVVEYEA